MSILNALTMLDSLSDVPPPSAIQASHHDTAHLGAGPNHSTHAVVSLANNDVGPRAGADVAGESGAEHPYRANQFGVPADDSLRVPYGGQTRMRLAITSGLAHARLAIDLDARDLIAVRCSSELRPRLQVVGGEIALGWRGSFGGSFGGWLRDVFRPHGRDVTIVLHPAVDWTLAIHGGLAHCELDLVAGQVARVDIQGGCSQVSLDLPAPRAHTPIRIAGGAAHLTMLRPANTAVVLAATGGLAGLRLDDQRFDAIGGAVRLETRTPAPDAPRYELQLAGGASQLAVAAQHP